MAVLTDTRRDNLSDDDFALPGRRFPIENKLHARAALDMAHRGTTPEEAAQVRSAVYKRYPDMKPSFTDKIVVK
jgi:hypothetical protein